ncbi:MAG: hypothetical protein F7B17_03980 [Desulfurococcales archaeon]|nr:hypothetical protein [Desulfurococcales archaeon]
MANHALPTLIAAATILLAVSLQPALPNAGGLVYVIEVVVESGGAVAGWERIVYYYEAGAGSGRVLDYYVAGVHMAPQDAVAVLEELLRAPPLPAKPSREPVIYAVEGEVLPYKCIPAGEAPISFTYRGRAVTLKFEGEVALAPRTNIPVSAAMEARAGEVRLPGGVVLSDVRVTYTASLAVASEPLCGEPVTGTLSLYALTALALAVTIAAVVVFLGRERLRVY